MKSTAVLLDGAFVRKRLAWALGHFPAPEEVFEFACSLVNPVEEELFRIYYYDCLPLEGTTTNPISGSRLDLAQTEAFRYLTEFFEALARMDHVALRRGELVFRGWRLKRKAARQLISSPRFPRANDLELDLQQKRVDMKIGLDVAWLSTRRIVNRIILCTADSDFVPAMKFARREGVQVVLVHLGARIRPELFEHADEVRNRS
jgi:uncharacterized LabA/DUF88 family protein